MCLSMPKSGQKRFILGSKKTAQPDVRRRHGSVPAGFDPKQPSAVDRPGVAAPFEDMMPDCDNKHFLDATRIHFGGDERGAIEHYVKALWSGPE